MPLKMLPYDYSTCLVFLRKEQLKRSKFINFPNKTAALRNIFHVSI